MRHANDQLSGTTPSMLTGDHQTLSVRVRRNNPGATSWACITAVPLWGLCTVLGSVPFLGCVPLP